MTLPQAPAPAAGDHLTDAAYWDRVWQGKRRDDWSNLGWVKGHAAWLTLDHLLRRRLPRGAATRLLEVGCASGKWLVYFHQAFGHTITGCDYSEPGCESARRALAAARVPGVIVRQDLFTLGEGGYEVVFSMGLIEHFTDADRVVAKLAGALEPGGTLVTVVPNLAGLSGGYHRWLKPETYETHRVVTLDQLDLWHRQAGLVNLESGALGSIVPFRFPRDKVRRRYPRLYRALWTGVLRPVTWLSNRACIHAFTRLGRRWDSPRFSPYLYAVGQRPPR